MSSVRVIFLGTPDFACSGLQCLLNDEHYEVVGVITQPDRPSGRKMQLKPSAVKSLAISKNLNIISPENVNAPEVLEQIKSWNAEAAVVVAFGQLMSEAFLNLFPQRVVNLHASLLPRWRGAAPIQRALMSGDQQTGICLQVMVKALDAGDILGQRIVKLPIDMDALQLHNILMKLGDELLHIEFMDYLRGNLSPHPQEAEGLAYAKKIQKNEAQINWCQSAFEIHNQVRGLKMGPFAWTLWKGIPFKIHKTSLLDKKTSQSESSGTIVQVTEDFFDVVCGGERTKEKEILRIWEVQKESKPKMKVAEFLRGNEMKEGEVLGV